MTLRLRSVSAVVVSAVAVTLLLVASVEVDGLGAGEAGSPNDPIIVDGRITVSGNHPHTFVAINLFEPIDGNGSYKLTGDLANELKHNYQQEVVTVRLKVTRDSLGPGDPAEAEVLDIISPDE